MFLSSPLAHPSRREETIDGETVKFYAEAEDILIHLPKLGIPMIMRKIAKGEGKGTAKL